MLPLNSFVIVLFFALISLSAKAATTPGYSSEDRGYVAAHTCESCHKSEHESWSDSDHAWAMRPATDQSVLGDFNNTRFIEGDSETRFVMRENNYWVEISGPEGLLEAYRVAYTFGYKPLQQYLIEFPGGRLQALTIAWDSRPKKDGGQRWFSLYPEKHFASGDALHWTGRYQNWNAMCADCHSTNLTVNYSAKDDTFSTTWQEQNVGCQGCHGPGQRHVNWATSLNSRPPKESLPEDKGLDVKFNNLSAERVVETCAYCHSRRQSIKDGHHAQEPYLDKALPTTLRPDLYHSDGQIQGEVYVYGSFIQSKMSAAGVDCLDCHNPHTTKLVAEGNGLCLQCHNSAPPQRFPSLEAGDYASASHHRHREGSEGAQCVNCHMAEQTYMVVDPRRDHSFRIPRPDLTETTGSPNACNNCHTAETPAWAAAAIDRWFEAPQRPHHYANALSSFRKAEENAFIKLAGLIRKTDTPAIARATAGEHLARFGPGASSALRSGLLANEPIVRAYAANSTTLLPVEERVNWLMPLLAMDQPTAVRDQAIRALAGIESSAFPEEQRSIIVALRKDYEKRLIAQAFLPGTRLNLATYLQREGRYDEALSHYQAALRMDPVFAPARINLASLASARGNNELAIKTLEEGVSRANTPPSDRGHLAYLLALAHVDEGNTSAALPQFKLATELNPDNARIFYNYGLVLARVGNLEEASKVLLKGTHKHPNDTSLLDALIYLSLQQGKLENTRTFAKRLNQLAPGNPQTERLLMELDARLDSSR
ncbi:tetratricopeptide repeat protein [Marinobacter litoralis]|uniref:tetratricopeptide repeat protein n=1 Tax=Marinobacter litoralis TaxID=187981 RepID=UPI0018ED4955|nr:tetratricopeptide repeat protein [Marinobacter litoralis]